MNPRISIILPTFNRAQKIKSAIQSVINQTYTHWELIIIDDASTDNTQDIVKKIIVNEPRIRSLKNEKNLGLAKTPNVGLKIAQGEFIARIDDDDEWTDREKLEKQITYMIANPACVLVGTSFEIVDAENHKIGLLVPPEKDKDIRNIILSYNPFGHSTVLFRKDIALKIGGYNEDLGYTEDYDLWLRLGQEGELANLQDTTVKYTESKSGMSYSNRKQQLWYRYVLIKKYGKHYPREFFAWSKLFGSFLLYHVSFLRLVWTHIKKNI